MEDSKLITRDYLAIERTHLANERTFLAYFRTSVMFVASGVAIIKLPELQPIISIGYILCGLAPAFLAIGIIRYYQMKVKINGYYR